MRMRKRSELEQEMRSTRTRRTRRTNNNHINQTHIKLTSQSMKSSQHTRTSGGGVPALAGRVQFQLTRIEIDGVVSCTESDLLVGRRELDLNI
jgi:hypothetical protein